MCNSLSLFIYLSSQLAVGEITAEKKNPQTGAWLQRKQARVLVASCRAGWNGTVRCEVREPCEWSRALVSVSQCLFQYGCKSPSRRGGSAQADVAPLSPRSQPILALAQAPLSGGPGHGAERWPWGRCRAASVSLALDCQGWGTLWDKAVPSERWLALPLGCPHGHQPLRGLLRRAGATALHTQRAAGRDAGMSQ